MKIEFPQKLNKASILLSSLVLLYVIFRSIIFFTYEDIVIWPDSADYARISTKSIWSEDFWHAHRPTVYPYLIKSFSDVGHEPLMDPPLVRGLLGYKPKLALGRGLHGDPEFASDLVNVNVTALSVFQFVFSVFSWIVFAVIGTAAIKRYKLRLAGIALLLLISLDQNVTLWDRHILTESISMSLFLLCVSLPFLYIRYERGLILVLAGICGFVYAGTKGTDAYMLLAMSFLLLVVPILLRKPKKLGYFTCAAAFLAISMLNFTLHDKGHRSVVPLMNVLNSRIIAAGYEEIYGDFRKNGMPSVPDAFFEQHWYAPFDSVPGLRDWLVDEGPRVYKKYLI